MSNTGFVTLPHRGLISISGADAASFLQNIISNDIEFLNTQPQIHACLLTPQGKYLHDFYVTHPAPNTYHIECEGGERSDDLAKRLGLYKLRAKITIVILNTDLPIYIQHPFANNIHLHEKPQGEELPYAVWDEWRISEAIPDGSRDAEIGASTLSEINLDTTAVSYTKGCYVGQELVARMHNRNLGKKQLTPVLFKSSLPNFGDPIIWEGQTIGEMRSKCGKIGLVLLRIDSLEKLPKSVNFLSID